MNKEIAKALKTHRHWLANTGNNNLSMFENSLSLSLDKSQERVLPSTANGLSGIATFYAIRGIVRTFDGDAEGGLDDFRKSLCYRGWSVRVSVETFFRTTARRLDLTNDTADLACLACVSKEWSDYAVSALRRIDECPTATVAGHWESRRLEHFVLDVCDLERGQLASRVTLENEPYRPVISAWQNTDALRPALENACDYHCRNIEDRGQDWNPEFKWPPFDLLPCEWMLVSHVRKRLGLPMPDVTHPLISALGVRDQIPAYSGDENLDRLAGLMKRFGLD